jgi:aspartyl-tRNA(Asn)/glutamyl-tRNA(Gln) amidotransferase subunit A
MSATRADAARERIGERSDLNAFITLSRETGDGPTVAVKDLIDVEGLPTTGGGPLSGVPEARADAAAVAGARRAGAVVVGKANLYEWGFGVASDNLHHGPVRNPRDPARSAGGSSSGCAAAVAAELCDWAIGTDTAGSVRIPAALCGVVGFKPSRGMVPLEGVLPLSPSQDTVGVLAPSVETAWRAAASMSDRLAANGARAETLRLAVPDGWVDDDLDGPTAKAWAAIADGLPRIPFPDRRELYEVGTDVQAFEAEAAHRRRLEAEPGRYRHEVKARLARGRTIDERTYQERLRRMAQLAKAADHVMREVDALVLPTTACVAPLLIDPEPREPLTRFTRPFNVTGQPAFSLPVANGALPVGLQVVGRLHHDADLARVAAELAGRWS